MENKYSIQVLNETLEDLNNEHFSYTIMYNRGKHQADLDHLKVLEEKISDVEFAIDFLI